MNKKLFLTSSFEDVYKLLLGFIDGLEGKVVTFIPTASIVEEYIGYVESGKKSLEKLGMIVDELEISTARKEDVEEKIKNNDFIYVSGGNTFFLLENLKKTGADKLIKEEIEKGKLYIGESAGSAIMSPNIEYVKLLDDREKALKLQDFTGLEAVDFYIVPHYKSFPYEEEVDKLIEEYKDKLKLKSISNQQVILVDGEDIKIEEL